MALTYSEYLKIDGLLKLQEPRSDGPEHDEMLFIITHQVYELWFKQIIHEIDYLKLRLEAKETAPALNTFKRILTILKVLVAQLDILETMTPLEFLSFRERLETSSGFQSHQFRVLEYLLGNKSHQTLENFKKGTPLHRELDRRFRERSLWDSFLRYLANCGYDVPTFALQRDLTTSVDASEDIQTLLKSVYREDFLVASICERLVDLDEGMQEWRYRHLKMVERTIGNKQGTGGSTGVDYLKGTLFKPLFPDLWAIRNEF
ncbi:MAG: tryptophan 2,3-dioxygenase family protein [Arenicellales bacterium]|nr:tryptophan 2,3-dioxygenase family protein [Arenicellales bacterium]